MATDAFSLLASLPLAFLTYELLIGGRHNVQVHLAAFLICAIGYFLIRLSRDGYSHPLGRLQYADPNSIMDYALAYLLSIATVWQLGLADEISRGLILLYGIWTLTLLLLGQALLRRWVRGLARTGRLAQRVAIFGADAIALRRAVRLLDLERLPHLRLIGVADDRSTRIEASNAELPFVGGFEELVELARQGELDQVLICLPDITQLRLDEIVERLSSVSVDLLLVPREALLLDNQYRLRFIGSFPVLSLWERPVRDFDVFLKACEDKLIAALALVLVSPLLLLTAIAIKIDSRGPIFFRQRRFGFNNMEIQVLKFRSMHVDRQDESGAARTIRNDPRVTRVGRIIRRLSIDELPQLWNVILGEMSVVGPRPHATSMKVGDRYYFDAVKGYASRHRVKPGITGLAQVRGLRGEIDSLEKAKRRVELDCFYVENWSISLDMKILIETIFKIVAHDAY